jgi:fido (protein-threonine AMPylation protein)
MKTFGEIIRSAREQFTWTLSDLSMRTGIDSAILSKIERSERTATRKNVIDLCVALSLPLESTLSHWLSDKILREIGYDNMALEALMVAEDKVKYRLSQRRIHAEGLPIEIKHKLAECDELLIKWKSNRPLDIGQIRKMEEYFRVNYTYESNRIEGNTLTMQETHMVVNQGITIGGKSMREHLEAINHSEAIDYLYDLVARRMDFNERVLKELHHLVLKGIDRENAGKYRNVPVRIGGASFVPAQPYLVPKLMEDVFVFYVENKDIMHPVVLAAEMHERIVTVHPFIDGNGRTSRLVMNLILLSHGYTIANLKGDNTSRLRYYTALEKCQVAHDKSAFIQLIAETTIDSLKEHLELCG